MGGQSKGHIFFRKDGASPSGKTNIWAVDAAVGQIGQVRWFGRWRRYCFYPRDLTVFDHSCLEEIASFCRGVTSEHMNSKDNAST